MSLRLVRPALGALAALVSLGLAVGPAQAAPRTPDPELALSHAAPHSERRVSTADAAPALPATVDSDVYAYALSPTSKIYFVVAGHLTLHLRKGSTTAYGGTFVDYVGNKSAKASADASRAEHPVLKIKATNGRFRFTLDQTFGGSFYSGTATTVPSALKVRPDKVFFAAATHSLTSVTKKIVLSERSGPVANPFEYAGTLTMVYDANGRISGGSVTVTNAKGKSVTHALKGSGFVSTGYFYTLAKVDKTTFGLGASSADGTTFSGFGFRVGNAKTSQWVLSATA